MRPSRFGGRVSYGERELCAAGTFDLETQAAAEKRCLKPRRFKSAARRGVWSAKAEDSPIPCEGYHRRAEVSTMNFPFPAQVKEPG